MPDEHGNGHGEEDLIKKLIDELDRQTEPYAAWNSAKPAIQRGTGTTRAVKGYMEETFGPKLTDKVEEFAVDYLGGKKEDASHLAHTLRSELGEHYGQFRAALRHGDVDTANKLVRDATESKYLAAGLEGTVERLNSLKPDERIAAGKELAKKAGGDDYVAAATNPGQLAETLVRQKQLAETYKTSATVGPGGGGGAGGHH